MLTPLENKKAEKSCRYLRSTRLTPPRHPRYQRFLFTFHEQQRVVLCVKPLQLPSTLPGRGGFHNRVSPPPLRLSRGLVPLANCAELFSFAKSSLL